MAALLERSRARSDFILGEIFLPDFRGNPSNCCWHFSVWLTDWYYVFKNVGSDSYKVLLMGPKWFEALRSLRETRLWNTEYFNYFSIDGSVKKLWSSLNKKLTENSLNKDVKCAIKCFHVESGQNLWTELFSVETTGSWTHLSLTADFKITFLIIFTIICLFSVMDLSPGDSADSSQRSTSSENIPQTGFGLIPLSVP